MAKSFKELAIEANSLPIKEVLEHIGCVFHGSGINQSCLSPLREQASMGSFNINVSFNIFRDWKLDVYGGPVKLYMLYYGLEFVDAVKKMSNDFNLGGFQGRVTENIKFKILNPVLSRPPLDNVVIDKVYRIFLKMLELTSEDRNMLICRGFTDEEINEYQFKTFPRRTISFRKKLIQEIEKEFGTANVLFDVPGFYKKKDEIFSFSYLSGVIIPCKNIDNQIVGLQVRLRDKNADCKYLWFSSANCLKDDPKSNGVYERDGLSPGSPIGFERGKYTKKMFITEGFFKAVSIRKRYDMSVFSIQGVGNWKPLINIIEKVEKDFPKFKSVVIAYDSDMCYNLNVLNQAYKLGLSLMEKNIGVEYLLWEFDENTKGIDDLIECHNDIRTIAKQIEFFVFEKGIVEINKEVDMNSTPEEVNLSYRKHIFEKC